MDKIKWFFEKWYHRLQGHMLVTLQIVDTDIIESYWVTDIYNDDELFSLDIVDSPYPMTFSLAHYDVTITA